MSEHANNFETEQERQDRMKKLYISLLWEAAHAYEYAEVNGTGVGLLALGVLKGSPKALSCQAWATSIWALYYERKPMVTHEMSESLLDFSVCGPMPYTIPELMAEVL